MADTSPPCSDVIDLDLLRSIVEAEAVSISRIRLAMTRADPARLESLVARAWVVPDPASRSGVRVSVLGLSQLHRFLWSPVGSAGPRVPIHEECALRLAILDALEPEDREEIERRSIEDLLALRNTLFCSFQARCGTLGCPLSDASAIELCDLGLFRLSRERPWPVEGRARP